MQNEKTIISNLSIPLKYKQSFHRNTIHIYHNNIDHKCAFCTKASAASSEWSVVLAQLAGNVNVAMVANAGHGSTVGHAGQLGQTSAPVLTPRRVQFGATAVGAADWRQAVRVKLAPKAARHDGHFVRLGHLFDGRQDGRCRVHLRELGGRTLQPATHQTQKDPLVLALELLLYIGLGFKRNFYRLCVLSFSGVLGNLGGHLQSQNSRCK